MSSCANNSKTCSLVSWSSWNHLILHIPTMLSPTLRPHKTADGWGHLIHFDLDFQPLHLWTREKATSFLYVLFNIRYSVTSTGNRLRHPSAVQFQRCFPTSPRMVPWHHEVPGHYKIKHHWNDGKLSWERGGEPWDKLYLKTNKVLGENKLRNHFKNLQAVKKIKWNAKAVIVFWVKNQGHVLIHKC